MRFFLYVGSALFVTFVLPGYVFPLLGLQPGRQHLRTEDLTLILFLLTPVAILGARYSAFGSSGLILYSFVRGFFAATAINIPLIVLVLSIYQVWAGLLGILHFLSWLLFGLPILSLASYYLTYKGLGLLAWGVLMLHRLVSQLPVSTSYVATALFCLCAGVIHAPDRRALGPGVIDNILTWGQSLVGLLIPCGLFVAMTVPLLAILCQIPPLLIRKPASRLLYLRSFSSGRRSAELFRRLVSVWTEFGPIYTLSGPDIFLKTMDSRTFLAYLKDDLASAFISTSEGLYSRLETVEDYQTIDGRYRIEEFRCRGQVWQTVFRILLERCDVGLLDLRGFQPSHLGTAFELFTAVSSGHQEKIVFLADETTDTNYLHEIVAAAVQASSPSTATDLAIKVKVTDVTALGRRLPDHLLPLLEERVRG